MEESVRETTAETEKKERRIDKLAKEEFGGDIHSAIKHVVETFDIAPMSHVFSELEGEETSFAHTCLVDIFNRDYPGGWEVMRAEHYIAWKYRKTPDDVKAMKVNPERKPCIRDGILLLVVNALIVILSVLVPFGAVFNTAAIILLGIADVFLVGDLASRIMIGTKVGKLLKIYRSPEYREKAKNAPVRLDMLQLHLYRIEWDHGKLGLVEQGKI